LRNAQVKLKGDRAPAATARAPMKENCRIDPRAQEAAPREKRLGLLLKILNVEQPTAAAFDDGRLVLFRPGQDAAWRGDRCHRLLRRDAYSSLAAIDSIKETSWRWTV
jgi:hypothetical protein